MPPARRISRLSNFSELFDFEMRRHWLILFTFLAPRASAAAEAPGPPSAGAPSTVTATAQATVSAKPDVALLEFGVVTQAKTAGAAAAENARRSNQVVN